MRWLVDNNNIDTSTLQKLKLLMIVDYNKHMLGVNKLDQMMSYYSFLHKNIKWWRKVF